jgi:hypothetical protein
VDKTGKLFENILFAGILPEVSVCGLIRNEKFGFRPRHTTFFQLARLFERITRKVFEKRLKGADFLNVAKAFATV